MNLSMVLMESLETLSSNKLRSGLTVLGIVIGVAAVIAMLAVGNGATASITGSINSVGTNLLFVFRGARNNPDVVNPRPLTMSDANALLDQYAAPHVQAIAPVNQGNGTVEYGGTSKTTTIAGVTPPYKAVRNVTLLDGSFISDQDELGHASVVVIGVDVADSLFGHRDAALDGPDSLQPAGLVQGGNEPVTLFKFLFTDIRRAGFMDTTELVAAQVQALQHWGRDLVVQLNAGKAHTPGGFAEIGQRWEIPDGPHRRKRGIVDGWGLWGRAGWEDL